MSALVAAVAAGLFATAFMDAGNSLLARAGLVPSIDHRMIGRVLRSWLRGRWAHPSPASVPTFARERRFGYVGHYGIGVAFAVPFVAWGRPFGGAITAMTAVAYGMLTTAAAYLLLFPSMGLGLCGLRSPAGWRLPLSSLVNHAIYGGGLFVGLAIAASAVPANAAASTRMPPIEDADYHRDGRFPEAQVELGRLLFFDKVLSGNRNISCATCHHPRLATSDGLSLPLGEGAAGLGPERCLPGPEHAVLERVPRNSQALFNVGAREYKSMFVDGRVEDDPGRSFPGGFWTPAREDLPAGLENVVAAQAMFPVTSAVEMAGAKGENPVATAAALDRLCGTNGVWDLLASRLRAIPEYVDLFRAAFPRQVRDAGDVTFVLAANAIAAFETVAFRSDDSPFDAYLRSGDPSVLGDAAERGRRLFYGRARCADCHSGRFQSDQRFHAIAVPQIGPGKRDGFDDEYWSRTGTVARVEDYGRFRETGRPEDRYAFRTPALRNVELTGPWGHDGAFPTLDAVVRHHLDPVASLEAYDPSVAALPPMPYVHEVAATGSRLMRPLLRPSRIAERERRDCRVQESAELRGRIAAANQLPPVRLDDREVDDLVAFLRSLTDPDARTLDRLVPARVPSGLPVED